MTLDTGVSEPRPIGVLIVDDDPLVRTLLAEMVRRESDIAILGCATDGLDAVAKAAELRPNVILMDLAMPEMDGVEATRQLRERHTLAHIPIFVMSAYATADVKQDAMAAGCAEVFPKPLEIETLLGKIRERLGA